MAIKTFLLALFFFFSGGLFGNTVDRKDLVWEEAHKGNFSLVHKIFLIETVQSMDDYIGSQFVMVYLYYRMDMLDEMYSVLKGIDRYIERNKNVLE